MFQLFQEIIIVNNNFIQMSENKPRGTRAASARPADLRPSSSKNRKLHQKTQFIDNVYGSNNTSSHGGNYHSFQKNKLFSNRFAVPQAELQDVSKLMPTKPDQMLKQKQELFEQVLHLKQENNRLKDQLMKNRTKMEMLTSKNSKYTKQFNREFEKKMYWTGNNAYLISGVKAQYEKLKQELGQKDAELEAIKRQLIESRAPEYKVLSQNLLEENKKLAERIGKMAEVSQQVLFDNAGDKSVPAYLYDELEEKLDKLDKKLKDSQNQVKMMKQQNKQLNRKLEFIQKLLIEKGNSQYHAHKKAKKAQKQKVSLQQKIRNVEALKDDMSKNYETKLQKLKVMQDRRFKTEKDIFDRTIHEKDVRIQKLEKQVAYLSTLLTYWKPLDELKEVQEKNSDQEDNVKFEQKKQIQSRKKSDDNFILEKKNNQPSERNRRATQIQQKGGDFLLKSSTDLQNSIKQPIKGEVKKKVRVQQTADKRHNEEAQKKRKVDYKEVEHLGQHLKYRFLGLRLSIEQIRKYFDYQKQASNPQNNFILSGSQKPQKAIDPVDLAWQQEYITMRQAKQILKQVPFELPDEDAHLLARYLIEDSHNEYVYADLNNQHKRNVVKSIIRSLVGNYQLLDGDKQMKVQQECKEMLDKYQGNLLSALSTMASSGYISRKKFIQLLSSLGIQLSQEGKDFLVCKMLLKSESLNKLGYMIILE